MVRATTGGVLRSYRSNLMNSFITDNKARETVLTQRVFNSYADDPAAAAKAFRLRKSRMMTSSQLKICDDAYHKYQGAFASLQTVSELIDTQNSTSNLSTLKSTTLEMLNDPTGDAREQLNKVLDNLSETIVQNMNQKYGDEFIFAGADGHNVPFEVKEVDGKKQLYYRGVPVDAHEPNVLKFNPQSNNAEASVIMNEDGTVTPPYGKPAKYYLKMDNITKMSVREYEKLYLCTLPDLEETQDWFGFTNFTEYNRNGTPFTGADGEEGGYYLKQGGDPAKDLISKKDYYEMAERLESPPTVLRLANTKSDVAIFNANNGVTNYDFGGTTVPDSDKDNYFVMIVNGDSKDQVISKEDYDKACQDVEKLDYLVNEKRFVDIGLGFQEDENGKLIESSAFNECLNGLTFLGHGLDEEGDPKNIYSIVQRLKDMAASAPDAGDWNKELYDEFDRLVGKLEDAASNFKTEFTNQSAGTEKLKNNYDLLEDNVYNLKEQYSNLEDVNMADAITSFIWAEYCYNAALKVGNSILSQSLMDYLN